MGYKRRRMISTNLKRKSLKPEEKTYFRTKKIWIRKRMMCKDSKSRSLELTR